MKRIKKQRRHLKLSVHTHSGGRLHPLRSAFGFCKKNGRLMRLLCLLLIGALLGAAVFSLLTLSQKEQLLSIVSVQKAPSDFVDGCGMAASSAFFPLLMLAVLFLLGLTAFGVPLILPVPLFFGFGIGVAECSCYEADGLGAVALTVLPHMMMAAVGVLIASAESLRMSFVFSRQLLPASAHCGGMWQDFKLYLLRFLLCTVIVSAAAVTDVLLRLI